MDPLPFIRPRHLGEPSPTQGGAAVPPRRKASAACNSCRAKKSRCDGQKPFCSECIRFRRRCIYQDSDKRKKETWKSAINDLEVKNKRLEAIVESLKCESLDDAIDQLRNLRDNQHPQHGSSGADETSSLTAGCTPSSAQSSTGFSAVRVSAEERPDLTPRTDGSATLFGVDDLDLPPEDITRHAVAAFFTCGSTLFYIMPQADSTGLLKAVYERRPDVTKSMVCQLCALAAVGSYYCTDEIPAAAMERYYQQASSLLQTVAVEDDLGIMRVFACLSVYLILLKGTSARAMTSSGINIARHNLKKYTPKANVVAWVEWAKVLRTLAFTECWLSSTLDYNSGLGKQEVDVVHDLAASELARNPEKELNTSFIQAESFKLSLLSAQTFEYIRSTSTLSITDLQQLSDSLSTWLWELPPCMSLASLTLGISPAPDSAWRPLLFLHMLHINLQIIIYERVMRVILKRSANLTDDVLVREVLQIPPATKQIYESFAQQLARIVRLLYDDHCVLARCWITISACYHSSITLLLSAAQHLVLGAGAYQDLALEDLSHVKGCLDALQFCEDYDIAAMRLVDVITPLYQRLCDAVAQPGAVNSPAEMQPKTDITEDGEIPMQLGYIISQSVAAMNLPCQEIWV